MSSPQSTPRPVLPDPPGLESNLAAVLGYLPKLSAAISQALQRKVPTDSGVAELLLVSPRGNVYSVHVSDTGVLSTTIKYQPP